MRGFSDEGRACKICVVTFDTLKEDKLNFATYSQAVSAPRRIRPFR